MMTVRNLSKQQQIVVNSPNAELIGWDSKNRPVVRVVSGIPNKVHYFALTKNGDPADIKGRVTNDS